MGIPPGALGRQARDKLACVSRIVRGCIGTVPGLDQGLAGARPSQQIVPPSRSSLLRCCFHSIVYALFQCVIGLTQPKTWRTSHGLIPLEVARHWPETKFGPGRSTLKVLTHEKETTKISKHHLTSPKTVEPGGHRRRQRNLQPSLAIPGLNFGDLWLPRILQGVHAFQKHICCTGR